MRFRLTEDDAERLDCPQVIEFDENKLTGREAIALKKLTGWSMERLGQAMAGDRVVDDDGNQIWQLDEHGDPAKDEAGNRIPLRAIDPEALLVMAWLAVRRTAGDRPWKDFDINLMAMTGDDEVDEGKASAEIQSETQTTTA
jgi:hypothetical protein